MKKISLLISNGFLILLLAGCANQQLEPDDSHGVFEKTLTNGLKILVKPDTRAPVVVSQLWYKVGGSYEPAGRTGVSHVLEHMMFKGTDTLAPNEFSRIIAEQGGRDNAFTGRDYTAYFQTLEKSRLEIALKLESDRMRNLTLDAGEFAKEIEVVKEERRSRTDDKPESLTYERFMATAYTTSNYRNPIVGWPKDLDSMSVDDLRDWYERFYAPNNATLVVVGDVDPDQVFALAARYFEAIPRSEVKLGPDPTEPTQDGRRHIEVRLPAKVPYLMLGYHVPVVASAARDEDWEPYALEIAAYLLDGGKSARLSVELIRKQRKASSIGVSYDPIARKPTLFLLSGNPAQGVGLAELENAIKDQIFRLGNDPIDEKELTRVKTQIIAGKVYEADSSFYQGMRLGLFETNGLSWQKGEAIHKRLRAVTLDQVQAVIRKYLVEDNLTTAALIPDSENPEG